MRLNISTMMGDGNGGCSNKYKSEFLGMTCIGGGYKMEGVEFLGDEGVGGSGESGCVAVGELSVRRWHGLCVP